MIHTHMHSLVCILKRMHSFMYVTVFSCSIHTDKHVHICMNFNSTCKLHTTPVAVRLLRVCGAVTGAVRWRRGRCTFARFNFAARAAQTLGRSAISFGPGPLDRIVAAAGCNRAQVWTDAAMSRGDWPWLLSRRGGAAMGNRIIPVEVVTLHNTNQEPKCILKTSERKYHKQS